MPMPDAVRAATEQELPNPMGIGTLARYLAADYKTIYRAIRSGQLKAKKQLGVWTLRRPDVLEWLSDNWN